MVSEKVIKETYDFIVGYVLLHGYAPSYQNIVDGTAIKSKCSVKLAIDELFERGLIETDDPDNSARAFRVKELIVRRRD